MAGRKDIVGKALKVAADYFAPNTDEYAANLSKFYGSTDPALRKRFYTGTSKDKDFTAFQESRHGTWLTDDPEDASSYALNNDSQNLRLVPGTWNYEAVNSASRVIPSYARIENPYRGDKPDWVMKQDNYKKAQSDWFDQLRSQGYDAWVPDSSNGSLAVVLKNQGTNVKSAIGNQGTFDTTKKHMGKSEGGRTGYGPGGVIDDIVKMAGKIVSGADEPAKTGIRAYHSSPHDFDKFEWSPRTSMTGEGAQAYGAGLYFAENPSVSDRGGDYWRQFFNKMPSGPERSAAGSMFVNKFDRDLATAQTERNLKYNEDRAIPGRYGDGPDVEEGHRLLADEGRQALDMLRSGKIVGPRTYEVNINADPNQFLDWDKPLSEQSETVKGMLARLPGAPDQSVWPYTTGNDLYEQLRVDAMGDDAFMQPTPQRLAARKAAAPEVSKVLGEAGIPGIKYLDAGSRNVTPPSIRQSDAGFDVFWGNDPRPVNTFPSREAAEAAARELDTRSRNYVVFDDRLISIIRKYGIAGASAMLGYNLMEQLDPNQAFAASMADQDYQSSRPQRSMGGNNSVSGALNVARKFHGVR